MKKLTILFDADDTVENLSDCWIAMLNERYGTSSWTGSTSFLPATSKWCVVTF